MPVSRLRVATRPSEYQCDGVWTNSDDAVLMEKIASGNKSAYTEFLTRHLSAIVDFAWRHVGRRVDAEMVTDKAGDRDGDGSDQVRAKNLTRRPARRSL